MLRRGGGFGLAEQQDQAVLRLCPRSQLCGLIRQRLLDDGLCLLQIQFGARAGIELKFDDGVRSVRRIECLLRHLQQFIVCEYGQILIGHLRDQQNLRRLAPLH